MLPGLEECDVPGAFWSGCFQDPSGSTSRDSKYFKIAPAKTYLHGFSIKRDHELIFPFHNCSHGTFSPP